jgi:formamidopyrimidine-DNA glycosylase
MPELPEVETIRRELEPLVLGRTLGEAWAFPHPKFLPALDAVGGTVTAVGRRGKYLLFGMDDRRELIVHLGMTGSLDVRSLDNVDDPYMRAWWSLGGGEALAFRDVRRFGRLAVAVDGAYVGTLATQGPDALDPLLTADDLWRSLRASRRAVKTQLLSQRPLAGVGNIYADEALWLARIDPRSRRITRVQAAELLDALREVLTASLDHNGTTLRNYRTVTGESGRNQERLACYGRYGQPCFRCGTTLRRVVLDGRTTTWCPTCQRRR